MFLFDFVLVIFAASAVVDVWFNGSIFAELRTVIAAVVEDVGGEPSEPRGELNGPTPHKLIYRYCPVLLAELLQCPFCLSYHVPWILILLCVIPGECCQSWFAAIWFKLPVYSLAATRIGNIINALLPPTEKYTR